MIISHRYKYAYIKTLKTGGTSLEQYLHNNYVEKGDLYTENALAGKPKGTLNRKAKHYFDVRYNYYSFAVVRNPWDKVVSQYHHIPYLGEHHEKTFDDWIKTANLVKDWYRYADNLKPRVSKIVFYEFLEEGLNEVFDTLELDFNYEEYSSIKLRKFSGNKNYRDFYTEETKNIVSRAYRKEIKHFGYKF